MSDKNISVSKSEDDFYDQIKTILLSARDKAYTKVNFIMVKLYLSFPIVQTVSAQLTWSHSEEDLKAEIEKDIFELGLMVGDDG